MGFTVRTTPSRTNVLLTPISAPVQHLVEYHDQVLHDNIEDLTPFQGDPTDEKDALWESLYENTGITVVDAVSAKRLPNATVVLPGTEGEGLIQLEVFHQLHCV
ncbi:tat pathway signal sequence, partial [Apiospora phragmitis]